MKEWKNSWHLDYLNGDASTSAYGRKQTFTMLVLNDRYTPESGRSTDKMVNDR